MSEEREQSAGITRRGFAIGAGCSLALLGLGGTAKYIASDPKCRPPGGQEEDGLIGACLRCEKCREVCPNGVIAPAHLEDGFINTRTPLMNFKLGFCDYCKESHEGVPQCVEVCPTRALALPEGATPENVIIGKAIITEPWCLAYGDTGCRTCVDACKYEALELDEYNRPHVIYDKCNGCGECEYVCISMTAASLQTGVTDRAIVVRPVELYEELKGGLA
ncbi:MAG: 4Fe-4S dicluster domain-containing protein [Actinobacteria bacterium]|nr:4Fe-4S dicluster domain-containing protein [Actinomycetota bacterium]